MAQRDLKGPHNTEGRELLRSIRKKIQSGYIEQNSVQTSHHRNPSKFTHLHRYLWKNLGLSCQNTYVKVQRINQKKCYIKFFFWWATNKWAPSHRRIAFFQVFWHRLKVFWHDFCPQLLKKMIWKTFIIAIYDDNIHLISFIYDIIYLISFI